MIDWDFERDRACSQKWSLTLSSLSNGELWYVITWIAHRLLVPCWLDREDVRELVGCEVSEEEFREFHRFVWKYGDEAAADLIIEYWTAWRESGQWEDWQKENGEEEVEEDC